MFEDAQFGEFTIRQSYKYGIAYWLAPCGEALKFKDTEMAEKVNDYIRFHLIVCAACHA
jgi:hypothetical protein